jgi:hypothetical protein
MRVFSYVQGNGFVDFAFLDDREVKPWRTFVAANSRTRVTAIVEAVKKIVADPTSAGVKYAARTGDCYLCGRPINAGGHQHRGHAGELAAMIAARETTKAKPSPTRLGSEDHQRAPDHGAEHISPRERTRSPENTPAERCGVCRSEAVLRESRYGPFLGCSRYPKCRATCAVGPDGKRAGKWKGRQPVLSAPKLPNTCRYFEPVKVEVRNEDGDDCNSLKATDDNW